MRKGWSPRILRSRSVALTLSTWTVLAAAEVQMIVYNGQSKLLLGAFSLPDRATLIACELVALLLVSMLLALPVACVREAGRRGGGRFTEWAARASGVLWAGMVTLLLASSWLTFFVTGKFLNREGVRLWLSSPVQMMQHAGDVQTEWLVTAFLVIGVGAVMFGHWLPALVEGWNSATRASVGRKLGLVAASCLALALLGDARLRQGDVRIDDAQAGRVYTATDSYQEARSEETGPAASAASEVWGTVRGGPHGLEPTDDLVVSYDSLLRPGEYATRAISDPRESRRYNVLVVLVESLRPDQLARYGGRRSVMPHVDSVAAESRVFLDVYSQASHSNYSDISPLSGQYPLRSERMYVYPEDPPYPTTLIYDVLSELGYRTAIFSSQNENWGGMLNYLSAGALDTVFHSETFQGDTYIERSDAGFAGYALESGRAGKVDDRHTVDAAMDWIDGGGEAPFFIYMNLQNSHTPYRTPEGFRRFGSDSVETGIRFGPMRSERIEAVKDDYANSLAYVDAQLGRLFARLRETGAWENTVVILSGDTGQAFLEHGFTGHAGPLYEEVVRVPLIIRAPDVEPGLDRTPAEHVDVPPTVLDLLGLPAHPGFQGRSLLDPVRSPRARFLVAQTPLAHQYAVVVGNWKYFYDVRRNTDLLFDLATDPGETVNLADRHPEIVRTLQGILGRWTAAQRAYFQTPALYTSRYPPDYGLAGDAVPLAASPNGR